ncbi:hypothetical protein ON010_g7659 [Phytophthora cinnamomi]|nr:hypothetical protein ON010_g7659 [Phytophthora cinnamomi]
MALAVVLHTPALAAVASPQMLTRSARNLGLEGQRIALQDRSHRSLSFRQRLLAVLTSLAIAEMVAHALRRQALAVELEAVGLLAAAPFGPLWLGLQLAAFALAARRAGPKEAQARAVAGTLAVTAGTDRPGRGPGHGHRGLPLCGEGRGGLAAGGGAGRGATARLGRWLCLRGPQRRAEGPLRALLDGLDGLRDLLVVVALVAAAHALAALVAAAAGGEALAVELEAAGLLAAAAAPSPAVVGLRTRGRE